MIGVILPSRGLIFAEVEDAISKELSGNNYRVYRSWGLKIPECENYLVEKALKDNCSHLLFIEEDTVIPEYGFFYLMEANSDIACIDYGVSGWSTITRDKKTSEILWCGLGCTLIKREVFLTLQKPWFRSDKALLLNFWPEEKWIDAGKQAYGGQDIWFCINARKKGFRIKQVPDLEAKHLRLDSLGKPEINNGLHQISQKPRVENYQTL